MRTNTSSRPLPYKYYYFPVLLLVLLGLTDTLYLALSHYRNYTDITYSSFCAISKAINCDTVSQSPWSILFGMPVALWGLFGYLLYGTILIAARKKTQDHLSLWSLLFLQGLLFSLVAIYFGYVSGTKIHSYCILCILSYAISFALLIYSWLILRRFDTRPFLTSLVRSVSVLCANRFLKITLPILIMLFIGVRISLPHYWTYTFPAVSAKISTGMTKDLSPWIGAEHPILTIEEYSDYQCFQCYKMHFMLRRLISRYPTKIRLIHRHYPMDNTVNEIIVPTPFHVGSGKMAMMAIYASFKDKFWQANNALFQLGREKKTFNTRTLAQKTGIPSGELAMATRDPKIRLLLQRDIRKGMLLHITGTPTFVIDDQVYMGSIPAGILEKAIQ